MYGESGRNCIRKSFVIFDCHKIYSSNQIKENDLGICGKEDKSRRVCVRKPERDFFKRRSSRLNDNIKTNIKITEWKNEEWIRKA
jgi:hypothetical protein